MKKVINNKLRSLEYYQTETYRNPTKRRDHNTIVMRQHLQQEGKLKKLATFFKGRELNKKILVFLFSENKNPILKQNSKNEKYKERL